MKVVGFSCGVLMSTLPWFLTAPAFAADVRIETEGSKVRLTWPAAIEVPGQGIIWPEYSVSHSSNLIHWNSIRGKLRGSSGRSGPALSLTFERQTQSGFFRLMADVNSTAASELADGGGALFGYGSRFAEESQRVGFMSVEEFAASVPQPAYLGQITWDPTTAVFWTNFYTNAAFRLNAAELARFKANGFVVSERLGGSSFGGLYYAIFHGDLPVFITTDSVLQAWHRTYLNMLQELEVVELATLMELVITNMAKQLPLIWNEYGQGSLRESILDSDFFLTVARSLWAGNHVAPSLPVTGQQARVTAMLAAINNLKLNEIKLFSTSRLMDFSQFKVRGHYTSSERLGRYFRTMMWLGRTDLRLASFAPNDEDDIRQLGTAIILHHLLKAAGQYENWSAVEQITRAFVGVTDSMTFNQLGDLLAQAGIDSPADVRDLVTLTNLQTRLLTGELGAQAITELRHDTVLYAKQSCRAPRKS